MKKIILVIMSFVTVMMLARVNTYASPQVEDAHITDTTAIKNDLAEMNLPYDDYVLTESAIANLKKLYSSNKTYEQFVIAVGENYSDLNNIVSYVYCYSPLFYLVEETLSINLTITTNKGFSNQQTIEISNQSTIPIKEDKEAGILCFKFTLFNQADLARSYTVEVNNSPGGNIFECTYKTMLDEDNKQRCDNFNFNGLLYITEDILCAVKVDTWDYNNMFGSEWWLNVGDILLNGASDVSFWFYNFSSSVDIEEILEADISYYSYTNVRKYTGVNITVGWSVLDKKFNQVTKYPEVVEQKVFGQACKFNAFATPASARISEFKDVPVNKDYFNNYQHSILIDIGKNRQHVGSSYESGGGGLLSNPTTRTMRVSRPCWADEDFTISQFSLTRIKHNTNGVIYNSYVLDTDGPDDSTGTDTPENPNDYWWNKLVSWIIAHPGETLAIVAGIVIGIPLIISFLPTLMGLIVNTIVMIFKAIVWLISLPVKVLLFPFRRKE